MIAPIDYLIDLPDGPIPGRSGVYLDPTTPRIYTREGERAPSVVTKFGIHLHLGWIPSATVVSSLQEWFVQQEEDLRRIMAGFSSGGTGGAPRGEWTRQALLVGDAMTSRLSQACRSHHIAIWWRASEYYDRVVGQNVHTYPSRIMEAGGLEVFAQREVEKAREQQIWLRHGDVVGHLHNLLVSMRNDLDSRAAHSWWEILCHRWTIGALIDRVDRNGEIHAPPVLDELDSHNVPDIGFVSTVLFSSASSQVSRVFLIPLQAAVRDDEIWRRLCQVRDRFVHAERVPTRLHHETAAKKGND